MDPVHEPSVTPTEPVLPAAPVTTESANTPNRPEEVQQTANPDMDTSEDTTQPPQEAATEEIQNTEPATETVTETPGQTEAPVAEAPEPNPAATEETTQAPETEPTEQPETAPAPPEEEPATWAGVEEDTSSPDEEELKNIESSDGDYSALECMSISQWRSN